jgi:hypothetical protein
MHMRMVAHWDVAGSGPYCRAVLDYVLILGYVADREFVAERDVLPYADCYRPAIGLQHDL